MDVSGYRQMLKKKKVSSYGGISDTVTGYYPSKPIMSLL